MDNKSAWSFVFTSFEPENERLRESLCTLGNGYLGIRGACNESEQCEVHYPGTYLAGVFNKVPTMVSGKKIFNEDLVNCPNWLYLTFRIAEEKMFSPLVQKILFYKQELDMRNGILKRSMRVRDAQGRETFIETTRIVSMDNPHYGVFKYSITPENYNDWISIKTTLDGDVKNLGVDRYKKLAHDHLISHSVSSPVNDLVALSVQTTKSRIDISMAAKLKIILNKKEIKPFIRTYTESSKSIGQEFYTFVKKKKTLTIEKYVSFYTSKDKNIINPVQHALSAVKKIKSFESISVPHKQAWDSLWKRFDIHIDGDIFAQKTTRFNIFHLLQTASPHNVDFDAGFPARGLSGEAYRGHIFWDEIYALHMYDNNYPEITKSLLNYRFMRMEQARRYAKMYNFKGSMFPWQSGSTGVEETQVIHLNPMSGKWGPDFSSNQRHVSFAIAYNSWSHWNKTNDLDFLKNQGAEILLGIAKFSASLVKFNKQDMRYHTHGLMGPDEFHEKLPWSKEHGLKDNAYSNFMISWILLKARESLQIIPAIDKKRLLHKYKVTIKDLDIWSDISRKMCLVINKDGIISQFDGYFKLKELNWDKYRKKFNNIHRMDRILKSENKSPDSYKVAKQADTMMIFYLFSMDEIKKMFEYLGYRFLEDMLKKNYEYYVQRTSHGSTLSKVVHCYLAFHLKKNKEAWNWYQEVLNSDICDTQGGTTSEGLHCGVMGGSVDIVTRAFAGVKILEDKIIVNPSLPQKINEIKFKILVRGVSIGFIISKRVVEIKISSTRRKIIIFEVDDEEYKLQSGKTYEFIMKKKKGKIHLH